MRAAIFVLFSCAAILVGCSKPQNFDADYDATDAKLKAEMQRLDDEIDSALKREPGGDAQKDAKN